MGVRSDKVRKTVYIEDRHQEYLQETGLNLSMLVRQLIEDRMEKDDYN